MLYITLCINREPFFLFSCAILVFSSVSQPNSKVWGSGCQPLRSSAARRAVRKGCLMLQLSPCLGTPTYVGMGGWTGFLTVIPALGTGVMLVCSSSVLTCLYQYFPRSKLTQEAGRGWVGVHHLMSQSLDRKKQPHSLHYKPTDD